MKKIIFSTLGGLCNRLAFFSTPCYNKNMKNKKDIKRFPYKLTTTMYLLAFGVIALCLGGIGICIYRIAKFGVNGFTEYLQSPLLIAICLLGIAVVISILVKSEYAVDEQYFYTRFGFIKDKFSIKDITSLLLNTDTNKLTVYFGENYTVLAVNPTNNDEIIKAIREVNPNVEFSFTMAENTPKDEQ